MQKIILISGLLLLSACSNQLKEQEINYRPFNPESTLDLVTIQSLNLDLNDDSLTPEDIMIAEIDLNQDGIKDRITSVINDVYCGNSGCFYGITIRNQKKQVTTNIYAANSLAVLASKQNGYYQLLLNQNRLWSWDGEKYAL